MSFVESWILLVTGLVAQFFFTLSYEDQSENELNKRQVSVNEMVQDGGERRTASGRKKALHVALRENFDMDAAEEKMNYYALAKKATYK